MNGWFPLHDPFLEDSAVAENVEVVGFEVEGGALQGYLIDKKIAEQFGISALADLAQPEVIDALDRDGNGKADLIGCNVGWSCAPLVEEHLIVYGLQDSVEQIQADYSPMMLETVWRYRAGEPVLFYTFTPNWTIGALVPGKMLSGSSYRIATQRLMMYRAAPQTLVEWALPPTIFARWRTRGF